MNHDLRLRKLKQKSEFRKLEDERRRRKLEEEQVNHSNNNDNSTLQSIPQQAELEEASSVWKAKPPKDEATIVPVESAMPRAFPLPRATTTTPSKPSATLDAAAAAPPYHSYNTITSNNKMPLQDVGLRHFQASPASSVSMSQSPWKKHVAATTEAKSRATSSLLGAGNASIQSKRGCDSNHDDNGSSEEEEEDVLGIALQKLRQKNSEACTASVAVALDTDGVVPTEQQQPSQRSSLDPNKNIRARKEIDDNDIRNENVSGSKTNASDSCQSEAYSNLTNNKATIASVPHQQEPTAAAVEPKKGPRNPLVLMREQIAADLRNTRLPPKPWDDQKHELWSTDDSDKDDDDDKMARSPVSPSSSRGRLRRKEKNGRACHDEQLDDTDGKKRRRQSQVREKEISNGQLTIETVALVDELTLRGMKKPVFENFTFTPNDALFVVCDGNGGTPEYVVPPSIAIYLPDYQREGIEFMYRKAFVPMRGAILGHDMGLGKTVQTISLLAALFGKSGTGLDLLELSRRKKMVDAHRDRLNTENEKALMDGRFAWKTESRLDIQELRLPDWCPILIVCPNTVMSNWVNEFNTWAHFTVAVYHGAGREDALQGVGDGVTEVLVCPHSMMQGKCFPTLNNAKVNWKAVFVDEFHVFKNELATMATNLRALRDRHRCVIVGLTGTVMQNKHKDLWSLVDLVADGYFGSYQQFDHEFARPIKLARTSDATRDVVELGDVKTAELNKKLSEIYLRRKKEDVLADFLPLKDEMIIFCEPSPLQKEIYQHIIDQPDFLLLRNKNTPCDCGVNKKYGRLTNQLERTDYQRQHRKTVVKQGKCCFKVPKVDRNGSIDPGAILWRQQHNDDEPCEKCPSCTLFTSLSILYKLCSHVALLQAKSQPDQCVPGTRQRIEAEEELARVRQFIPAHLASQLPGGYFRESGIMDDHFALSGKMVVLDKLLRSIHAQHGRVLLFATSTKALDLIEKHIVAMGFSHMRMDGQTSQKKRTEIADTFKSNSQILVFLLSTKAMGVGLNLTEANFVIIFDVDWNPANDCQAQDRAYRIGQKKNVMVFRFVLQGTLEELKYLRQVYKNQLKCETIVDVNDIDRKKASRLFRGVAGDDSRKGELFGLENLLKFKNGKFMNYTLRVAESNLYGVGVHDTKSLFEAVKNLSEDELDDIGVEGDLFLRNAGLTKRGSHGKDRESDCDDEDDLGGMSQAVMDVCEKVNKRVDAVNPHLILEEARPEPVSSLSDDGMTGKHPMSQYNGREKVRTGDMPHADSKLLSRVESVPLACEASTVVVNDAENAANRQFAATNSSTIGTMMPNKSGESSAVAFVRDFTTVFDNYLTGETQSPMNFAVSTKPAATHDVESGTNCSTSNNGGSLLKDSDKAPTGDRSHTNPPKLPPSRNTRVVGKTTSSIRRGESGKTTFKRSDLFLPSAGHKKS